MVARELWRSLLLRHRDYHGRNCVSLAATEGALDLLKLLGETWSKHTQTWTPRERIPLMEAALFGARAGSGGLAPFCMDQTLCHMDSKRKDRTGPCPRECPRISRNESDVRLLTRKGFRSESPGVACASHGDPRRHPQYLASLALIFDVL
jgi:hypothetical protein